MNTMIRIRHEDYKMMQIDTNSIKGIAVLESEEGEHCCVVYTDHNDYIIHVGNPKECVHLASKINQMLDIHIIDLSA